MQRHIMSLAVVAFVSRASRQANLAKDEHVGALMQEHALIQIASVLPKTQYETALCQSNASEVWPTTADAAAFFESRCHSEYGHPEALCVQLKTDFFKRYGPDDPWSPTKATCQAVDDLIHAHYDWNQQAGSSLFQRQHQEKNEEETLDNALDNAVSGKGYQCTRECR